MALPTDKKSFGSLPESAAARLIQRSEEIIATWVAEVKKAIGSAQKEQHAIIVDTMPSLIINLAEALSASYPRELATDGTSIASEHGGERARTTRYSPVEIIKEYQILRDVLLQVLNRERSLSEWDTNIIIKSVDHAMGESLTAYFLVHEGLREKFIMTLTHDLRNPLSAIKVSTDLIFRNPDCTDRISRLASRISDNVRRIDRMTEDLLDASRVQFGEKLTYEVSELELLPLVQDTITQLAVVHGDRFILTGSAVKGFWNSDAFKRAIENLLVNAIKYGASATPISIVIQSFHERVILSVHNEGSHIPVEQQENLFQSFMRAESAKIGKKSGWGLGLAMVRGFAEAHGGSIVVDSAPGRGTTFIIDVPLDSRMLRTHLVTPGADLPSNAADEK